MPQILQFITSLSGLTVPESLGDGIKISSNLFLSNDSVIKERLLDKTIVDIIGKLETKHILDHPLFIYGEWLESRDFREYDPVSILNNQMIATRRLFVWLWLLRDNAAEFDNSYLVERIEGIEPRISANRFSGAISRHDFDMSPVTFSRSELLSLKEKFASEFNPGHGMGEEIDLLKKQTRLGRCVQAIIVARASPFSLPKIANYCAALEALFCAGPSEMTHKLAERVALFLGNTKDERIKLFTQMKDAYKLRSNTVHGDAFKSDEDEVRRVSGLLDASLRMALNRIYGDGDLKKLFDVNDGKAVDNYFLGQMFS